MKNILDFGFWILDSGDTLLAISLVSRLTSYVLRRRP